ncbi:MAG: hypothetical protein ACX936_21400 [Marinobacter sp.]
MDNLEGSGEKMDETSGENDFLSTFSSHLASIWSPTPTPNPNLLMRLAPYLASLTPTQRDLIVVAVAAARQDGSLICSFGSVISLLRSRDGIHKTL